MPNQNSQFTSKVQDYQQFAKTKAPPEQEKSTSNPILENSFFPMKKMTNTLQMPNPFPANFKDTQKSKMIPQNAQEEQKNEEFFAQNDAKVKPVTPIQNPIFSQTENVNQLEDEKNSFSSLKNPPNRSKNNFVPFAPKEKFEDPFEEVQQQNFIQQNSKVNLSQGLPTQNPFQNIPKPITNSQINSTLNNPIPQNQFASLDEQPKDSSNQPIQNGNINSDEPQEEEIQKNSSLSKGKLTIAKDNENSNLDFGNNAVQGMNQNNVQPQPVFNPPQEVNDYSKNILGMNQSTANFQNNIIQNNFGMNPEDANNLRINQSSDYPNNIGMNQSADNQIGMNNSSGTNPPLGQNIQENPEDVDMEQRSNNQPIPQNIPNQVDANPNENTSVENPQQSNKGSKTSLADDMIFNFPLQVPALDKKYEYDVSKLAKVPPASEVPIQDLQVVPVSEDPNDAPCYGLNPEEYTGESIVVTPMFTTKKTYLGKKNPNHIFTEEELQQFDKQTKMQQALPFNPNLTKENFVSQKLCHVAKYRGNPKLDNKRYQNCPNFTTSIPMIPKYKKHLE